MQEHVWKAKLAAWTHDPAEKALVLLRDPAGHEGGTVRKLREMLFPQGVPEELTAQVKKADHWASAADRPQFPRLGGDGPYAPWAQVRFADNPELIHPLSGERIAIRERLSDLDPAHVKAVSLDHFTELVKKVGADPRRAALAFWRFAPDLPAKEVASLWQLLPADTRVPDHTIWAHLDLASAFASAFAADGQGTPALLSMSFGPVQGFIAQARTTSDLWAGSHLLSRIVWEGLKVVCEQLGPDAVIFPQLRGIPLVDLWLRDEMKLSADLFEQCDWRRQRTDANPLFGAALPNKFMAVVPHDQVGTIAEKVTQRVRSWVQKEACETVDKLIEAAGMAAEKTLPCYAQIRDQLADFPEVTWASVPWSLVGEKGGQLDSSELRRAMSPFFPTSGASPGFLGSEAWNLLRGDIQVEDVRFFHPNAGVLYPALYDLLDRVGAAAKAVRPFRQLPQTGYRCSLCGENEWLTTDRSQLDLPPGKRKDVTTLWTKVADKRTSWARKGEHLCAPCAMKRLWPNRFADQVKKLTEVDVQRFVVSTHTMALATSLGNWLDAAPAQRKSLPLSLKAMLQGATEQAALPRKLAAKLHRADDEGSLLARKLPALLDQLRENDGDEERQAIEQVVAKVLGDKPEAYYAMILLDGDKMGAWLSGSDENFNLTFRDSWHTQIQGGVNQFVENEKLSAYLDARRPPSPARHMAISGALNGFSLDLVRHVVEDLYKGKLIYAGGDDVLAMISVDDLLPAMFLLRMVYSGIFPKGDDPENCWRNILGQVDPKAWLDIAKGHVRYKSRLYRMMGDKATASVGAVIAHHTTPLNSVLRSLREAERHAKNAGGRDAFAISVLKRAGGAIHLVCPWFVPAAEKAPIPRTSMGVLIRLRESLAGDGMSRRASYLVQQWANQIPDAKTLGDEEQYAALLATTLAYQFERQSKSEVRMSNGDLGRELAALALATQGRNGRNRPDEFLVDFLSVAEFLAREGRSGKARREADNV